MNKKKYVTRRKHTVTAVKNTNSIKKNMKGNRNNLVKEYLEMKREKNKYAEIYFVMSRNIDYLTQFINKLLGLPLSRNTITNSREEMRTG